MPHVLEGRDVAGLAQTGTGKTAAFLLPLMERIIESQLNPEQLSEQDKERRDKRMFPDFKPHQFILVLVPTRELAEQVWENAEKLKGESNIRTISIYGGVAYDKQKQALRDGVEIIVATPGRLIDLYKENLVDLKQVRAIVFDEADRMFDMGFKDDMKFILQRVPKERQFLVFSATLNLDVMSTAYQFGANPVEVNVSRDQATAENVEHKIFHVGQEEKGQHLLSLIKRHNPRQTIVFSNFKMNVPRISQFLNENGVPTVGISSLLTQSQRNRVMEQFKGESEHNILVATDVAARGLDIKGVDMVVNFELPDDPENYVHRIGRTGRAGEKGIAFSLVSDRDVDALARVEQYLRHKLEVTFIEDKDLIKDFKDMTSDRPSDRGFRGESRSEGGRDSSSRRSSGGGRSGGGGRSPDRDRSERRPERRSEPREGSAGAPGSQANVGGSSGAGGSRPQPGPRHHAANGATHSSRSAAPGSNGGRGGARRDGPRQDSRGGESRDSRDPRHEGSQPRRNGPAAAGSARGPGAAPSSQPGRRPQGGPGAVGGSRPGSHPGQRRHEGRRSEGANHHGRKEGGHKKTSPKSAPTVSIGKKVTGFFKKLFGG
jgi:ATP-dependent RNA helicase RhlB